MKITTNNQPRPLISWHELPEKIQEYRDYIKDDEKFCSRFFKYKGHYYDAYDMMRYPSEGWDAYEGDSYFSGILIRLSEDDDTVIVGRYCC